MRTAGADTNGGGFDPSQSGAGTDFSQQDSAQFTGTNLTVDATTNTLVTPDGHSPSSADIGNYIQITSGAGFTTGFYRITAQSGGKWTLDRSPAATSTAGGFWALGGALLTWAKAIAGTQVTAGNTIWVKSGTYTITSAVTPTNVANISVKGYGSTRGDTGSRPLLTTATNSVNLITSGGVGGWQVSRISFSNTAGTRAAGFDATGGGMQSWRVTDCVFDGFIYAIKGSFSADYTFSGIIDNCEFKNQSGTSTGYVYLGGPCLIYGNYFHGLGGTAILQDNEGGILEINDNIFYSNGKDISFSVTAANGPSVSIKNNSFVSTTGDSVSCTSITSAPMIFVNNIWDNGSGWAVNWVAGSSTVVQFLIQNNAFHNMTSGNYHNVPTGRNIGDVTLSATPFTNASGGDFTLNSTSGAGASCRAAGYPTPLGNSSTNNYKDLGAVQHQDTPATNNISINRRRKIR